LAIDQVAGIGEAARGIHVVSELSSVTTAVTIGLHGVVQLRSHTVVQVYSIVYKCGLKGDITDGGLDAVGGLFSANSLGGVDGLDSKNVIVSIFDECVGGGEEAVIGGSNNGTVSSSSVSAVQGSLSVFVGILVEASVLGLGCGEADGISEDGGPVAKSFEIVGVSVGVFGVIVLPAVSTWAAFALGVDQDAVTLDVSVDLLGACYVKVKHVRKVK